LQYVQAVIDFLMHNLGLTFTCLTKNHSRCNRIIDGIDILYYRFYF